MRMVLPLKKTQYRLTLSLVDGIRELGSLGLPSLSIRQHTHHGSRWRGPGEVLYTTTRLFRTRLLNR